MNGAAGHDPEFQGPARHTETPESPDHTGERHQRPAPSKAPLYTLGGVFLALLGTLVAQVVLINGSDTTELPSGDDEAASTGTQSPAEVSETGAPGRTTTTARFDDAELVTMTIAAGFYDDFSPHVDHAEAECMAREVVDMFTVDRLWQITVAMTEANDTPEGLDQTDPRLMTDDEVRRLNDRLRPCVSDEAADHLDF